MSRRKLIVTFISAEWHNISGVKGSNRCSCYSWYICFTHGLVTHCNTRIRKLVVEDNVIENRECGNWDLLMRRPMLLFEKNKPSKQTEGLTYKNSSISQNKTKRRHTQNLLLGPPLPLPPTLIMSRPLQNLDHFLVISCQLVCNWLRV